jgi:hypothetical protein
MIRIEVIAKSVYGETKFYPANYAAEKLAAIAGTKTLTASALLNAKAMGCDVVIDGDKTLNQMICAQFAA